jgi:hypothetical protein
MREFKGSRLQGGTLTERGKESFAILLSQSDKFIERNPVLWSIGVQRGIDDVNQRDFGAEGSRQIETHIRSSRRKRARVNRNQNFFESS